MLYKLNEIGLASTWPLLALTFLSPSFLSFRSLLFTHLENTHIIIITVKCRQSVCLFLFFGMQPNADFDWGHI